MSRYHEAQTELSGSPKKWLVTGAAGFIGSHLLESLLKLNQKVVGLDNFLTGDRRNLEEARQNVGEESWRRFEFIEDDIRNPETCQKAAQGVDFILHHAALGSVPASIANPVETHAINVTGFLNMLIAARDQKVARFIYAASSSTYGDDTRSPKIEDQIGKPLSPYAATKHANELYAEVFARCYGLSSIGLRYFNVFGPRQDPEGAYAAVIPRWTAAMLHDEPVYINGDGQTTRDFCYVGNVVQANLLAALADSVEGNHQVFNIAVGEATTLNELFDGIKRNLLRRNSTLQVRPVFRDFREGDVRHSRADIGKARRLLGYDPTHSLAAGLDEMLGSCEGIPSAVAGVS